MSIARYYDPSKNPGNKRQIAGVPLNDLTEEQFNELPEHYQRSVDASDMYRKTKPPSAKPERAGPKHKTATTQRVSAETGEQAAPAGVAKPPTEQAGEEASDG